MLKPVIRKSNGYRIQSLMRESDGKKVQKHLHQWVMLAFMGPPGPSQQVRHLDGDKSHNYLSNLRYGTAFENAMDKIEHGTMRRGETHPRNKLSERDVAIIRDALDRGVPERACALVFNVNSTAINKIKRGESWSWLHLNQNQSAAA